MSQRLDVCSPRPRKDSDKPYWHRVGTAWKTERGISITFDSLPLPDKDGRVSVALFEAREKQPTQPDGGRRPVGDDMDDAIPFAPEWRG